MTSTSQQDPKIVESFPWLSRVPNDKLSDRGLRLDTTWQTLDFDLEAELPSFLANLVLTEFPSERFAKLLPNGRASDPTSASPLSNRARNLLLNQGLHTVGAVLELSVKDLYDIRNAGGITVGQIVTWLARESVRALAGRVSPRDPQEDTDEVQPLVASELSLNGSDPVLKHSPALMQFLEDLKSLSQILGGLGSADAAPLRMLGDLDLPDAVSDILARLMSHSAQALFPSEVADDLLSSALSAEFARLDERTLGILRQRFFADEPLTLDDLGRGLGVTRERVRQLEKSAIGEVRAAIKLNSTVTIAAEIVREKVSHVIPLTSLVEVFPALGHDVALLEVPVWRVLDRLDDSYEIRDGWVAAPTVSQAVADFKEGLEEVSGKHRLAPIADVRTRHAGEWISQGRSNLRKWLAYCELDTLEGYVMVGRGSMLDRAVAVLAASAEPQTAEDIHDRLGIDRSIRSLKNQMSVDERFVRVGRNAWALAEWGMDGYTSIREAIRVTLEASGGSADLTDLADAVARDYGVHRRSVIVYASSYPFESHEGLVRLASSAKSATKSPAESRRVYHRDGGWLYRTTLTHDHVRGSGALMPQGFAYELALVEGASVERPGPVGLQTFYWTGLQPTFGSVKAIVDAHGFLEGDEVLFVLTGDGRFDIELVTSAGSAPEAAMAAIGREWGRTDDLITEFSDALQLEEGASHPEIRSRLLKRGEADLAMLFDEAISSARTPSITGLGFDEDQLDEA